MLFPVFLFKDKGSDYGVTVPGLPGCYSAGRTMDEAIANAKEAIELHLEGLTEDGEVIPEQNRVDSYKKEIRANGIAALVEVDTDPYEARQSERVNVTFPRPLLLKIDKASEKLGMTRSGLLQKAAKKFISEAAPVKAGRAGAVKENKSPYSRTKR